MLMKIGGPFTNDLIALFFKHAYGIVIALDRERYDIISDIDYIYREVCFTPTGRADNGDMLTLSPVGL